MISHSLRFDREMQINRVTGSWSSISSISKLAREGRQRLHTEYIMNRDHHAPIDDAGVFRKARNNAPVIK